MSKLTKKEIGAHVALLVAAIFWGTTFVAISSTSSYFPPAFLVFLRCAIGGGVLMLVFIKRLKKVDLPTFGRPTMATIALIIHLLIFCKDRN